MDLHKNGSLICNLRKAKGMTQKQIADKLNICAKTVSKWETGRGFPDVSVVSALAEILGVSSDIILTGDLIQNAEEVGNMKNTKFYVCPHCGRIMQGTGEFKVVCCGKQLNALKPEQPDDNHAVKVSEIENDFYITFNHEMTKEHFISFFAYVALDRTLTFKLYPEQDSSVRFPKMYTGKLYYYCNKHGLFEYEPEKKHKNQSYTQASLTSLMSAFSRAYHFENSENPIFSDNIARKLFSDDEYSMLQSYISNGKDFLKCTAEKDTVKSAINTQFAPTPIARAKFCEDSLETAIKTGTEQYVILASGLDTFSLRNNKSFIRVFEIDKKSTLDDKKRRLSRAMLEIPDNVKLISCDLSKDNILQLLKNNGFDASKKTFFSCLGLFYYLSNDEISKLFEVIADFAADGSTIVFDFADNHLFTSEIPRVKNMVAMAEKSGERMKSCFGYTELEKLLSKYNFYIYEFLNDTDIQNRYFSGCSDKLTAFEHINYALAVIKKN